MLSWSYARNFVSPENSKKVGIEKPDENAKFTYLNGFIGLLAMMVVYIHTGLILQFCGDLTILYLSDMSVNGFFVLSAFLLTYKIMVDLQFCKTPTDIARVFIKYTIKRFMRI